MQSTPNVASFARPPGTFAAHSFSGTLSRSTPSITSAPASMAPALNPPSPQKRSHTCMPCQLSCHAMCTAVYTDLYVPYARQVSNTVASETAQCPEPDARARCVQGVRVGPISCVRTRVANERSDTPPNRPLLRCRHRMAEPVVTEGASRGRCTCRAGPQGPGRAPHGWS